MIFIILKTTTPVIMMVIVIHNNGYCDNNNNEDDHFDDYDDVIIAKNNDLWPLIADWLQTSQGSTSGKKKRVRKVDGPSLWFSQLSIFIFSQSGPATVTL